MENYLNDKPSPYNVQNSQLSFRLVCSQILHKVQETSFHINIKNFILGQSDSTHFRYLNPSTVYGPLGSAYSIP